MDLIIFLVLLSPYTTIIIGIMLFIELYRKNQPIVMNQLNIGLLSLFIWSLISGLLNMSFTSMILSFAILIFMAINESIQNELKSDKNINKILVKIFNIGLLTAFIGIIEKILSYFIDMSFIGKINWSPQFYQIKESYRIYSTFGNPNVAGDFFGVFILIALYLFEQNKGNSKLRLKFVIGGLIFAYALFLTGSKGSIIGFEMGILSYAMFKSSKKFRNNIIGIATIVVIASIIFPEINHPVNTRKEIWLMNWDLFIKNPIFGVGLLGIYFKTGFVHAHNIFLTILTSLGIVGFSTLSYILFYTFKYIRALNKLNVPSIPLFAAIILNVMGHGIVDATIITPQGGILFIFSMGTIFNLASRYEEFYVFRPQNSEDVYEQRNFELTHYNFYKN
jgi:O-antigen ligase